MKTLSLCTLAFVMVMTTAEETHINETNTSLLFNATHVLSYNSTSTDGEIQQDSQLVDPRLMIVNGNVAPQGAYKFMASLRNQQGEHFCGASVIGRRLLLTAAHCISYGMPYTVVIGANTWMGRPKDAVIIPRKQMKGTIHPMYISSAHINDVAVIRLSKPLPAKIPVLALATPEQDSILTRRGVNERVIGWGYTSESSTQPSQQLLQVDLPVVDPVVCQESYPTLNSKVQICAGYPGGGKDACKDDSGGPLFSFKSGNLVQVGVVSFGKGCAEANQYGVYSRVSGIPWIQQQLK
jgi:trypsin